jgi:preprotein translocase subunit SecG
MWYSIFLTLYVIVCIVLVFIILVQKGKSSLGVGHLGGATQMLFGGSGGQDLFQKITWVLGTIFIAGSLFLSLAKTREAKQFHYIKTEQVKK